MESTQQSDRDTYRAIVLGQGGNELLLNPVSDGFRLPSVEIPRWQRIAENLTAAMRKEWGHEVVCLFEPDPSAPIFSAADHYQDSHVALFVPKGFRPGREIDFVIHFHGWNHTVAGTIPEYKLIEQFAGGGKNAILIVPQGPYNAPDSFDGKLEATNGFARFMDEAMAKLQSAGELTNPNAKIGTIILSGHSGGYHVMAAILNHGGLAHKIREVWLFDALYGGAEDFVAWQGSEKGRLLDIYTDHGGTLQETENLMSSLKNQGVEFFAAEETNVVPGNLLTNRLVFLHTDMVHNDVVAKRRTFENFIKTSSLHDP